jgi:alcohol dehydrogenase class IV
MRFEFRLPCRIVFGAGSAERAGQLAGTLGKRAFLAADKNTDAAVKALRLLEQSGVEAVLFAVAGEPTAESVTRAADIARGLRCDMAVGVGGGSAMDTAKAVSALLTNTAGLMEYLETAGPGRPLPNPAAPWMAVPTTAGTGAEATCNAVIASPEHGVKASLRHGSLFAKIALVDPELCVSVPPGVTAVSGLDALTQLIEPFVCNSPNPMVDALCRDGMAVAAGSLLKAFRDGTDIQARSDMSLAALYSGIALANARLGAVHGMAGPMGGMIPVPHGAACARLLPGVMEINIRALKSRTPDSPALARYREIAAILCGDPGASPEDGIEFIRNRVKEMHVPRLSTFGLTKDRFPELTEKSKKASSMKGNPIELTDGELGKVLEMEGEY